MSPGPPPVFQFKKPRAAAEMKGHADLAARVQSPGQGRDLREVAARAETEPGDRRVTAHARRRQGAPAEGQDAAGLRGEGARGDRSGGRGAEPDGGEEEPDKARGWRAGAEGGGGSANGRGPKAAALQEEVGWGLQRAGPRAGGSLGARGGEGERRVAGAEYRSGTRWGRGPGTGGSDPGSRGAGIPGAQAARRASSGTARPPAREPPL